MYGPLSHWWREGKTLVVRPLKKKGNYVSSSAVNINQPPGEPQEHYLGEVWQKKVRASQNFIKD